MAVTQEMPMGNNTLARGSPSTGVYLKSLNRRCTIIGFILACQQAGAIVDDQDKFYANPESSAFLTLGFDLSGSRGNQREQDIALELHSVMRTGPAVLMAVVTTELETINGEDVEDSRFLHLRYARQISGPHGAEILLQHSYEQFQRLDRRVVAGAGYRFEWWRPSEAGHGVLGLGLIREHERHYGIPGEQQLWRASLYVTGQRRLDSFDDAAISFTAYAQPALNDSGNLRSVAIVQFEAGLSERLSIHFGFIYRYITEPEPGIDSHDLEYASGLRYTFK
jgi:hypothetical protein